MQDTRPAKCQNCGGELVQGYLLGKQNRIRWSVSRKGMTIFHGVPLMKLEKGFWKSWKKLIYAPSIPAARCEKCKIVLFSYDNDASENPKTEIALSLFIATFLCAVGILPAVFAFLILKLGARIPLMFYILACTISLITLLIGIVFLKHALERKRFNKSNSN